MLGKVGEPSDPVRNDERLGGEREYRRQANRSTKGTSIPLRLITLRNETVELFRRSKAPVPRGTRLTYGIVSGITVVICCLLFGPVIGAFSLFGSMASQWINGRPFSLRARSMLTATLATVAATTAGVLGSRLGLLDTPVIVLVILVVATLYYTFVQLQGPGPLNLFYGVALGSYLGQDPAKGWEFIAVTALSGLIATTISCLLLIPRPRGPEIRALMTAREAVEDFEHAVANDLVVQPDILRQARDEAYDAVNRGWIVIHAARLRRRHKLMDTAMMSINQRLAAAVARSLAWPSPESVETPTSESTRLSPRFRARHGLRFTSVAWFTAWRIGLAGAVAGIVAEALQVGHPYWAILTATLIVNAWTSRIALTRRAVSRALGTVIGVLVFAGLAVLQLPAWGDVAAMIACLMLMNLIVMSNYGLAVIFITPMALLSSDIGSTVPPFALAGDRVFQTVIGAVLALLVVWLTGIRFPRRVALAQFRRTVSATESVLSSLASGGRTTSTLAARNELQYELITNGAAATKASADDPDLAQWRAAEQAATDLGYAAMAACWLPEPTADVPIRQAVSVLREAGDPTSRAPGSPFRDPRRAATVLGLALLTLSERDDASV
ncbi:FUSC family protein [Frondihabitans cladoniiphilus]|uniref:FUSC family protein n=1 Tax=Frondihabitans cladoniiphilus TaxID=715785 RepID=A0ABP8W5Q0_9MICO